MSIPFEFVIDRPPVSQQARRRRLVREWTQDLQTAAKQHWDNAPPYAREVKVAITYFFEGVSIDVDNVPKPILDALKGLVYVDDVQVTDLLCRKRELSGELRIQNPSPILVATLSGLEEFLHIVVSDAQSHEVAPW